MTRNDALSLLVLLALIWASVLAILWMESHCSLKWAQNDADIRLLKAETEAKIRELEQPCPSIEPWPCTLHSNDFARDCEWDGTISPLVEPPK